MSADLTPADEPVQEEGVNPSRLLIANAAGWLGLILTVATLLYWAITGNFFDLVFKILAILALMALGTFGLINPQGIVDITTGRATRNILGTLLMVGIAIGILGAINVIYSELAKRAETEFLRKDFTAGQQNSLSPQSIRVAREIDKPVTVYGFFTTQSGSPADQQTADNLLKEYAKYSSKLTIKYVDPYVYPAQANQYGITRIGAVVFDNGTRHETASANTEEGFTQALLALKSNVKKTVALLNTPSVLDFTGTGSQQSLPATLAYGDLGKENYTVLPPVNLVISKTISPADVNVLIVPPAPVGQTLPDATVRAIGDYLDKGGHVLLIGDPLAAPLPSALLQKYGLREDAKRGAIGETSTQNQFEQGGLGVGYTTYGSSPITRDMAGLPTIFRAAEPILTASTPITGYTVTPIVQSSSQAVYVTFTDAGGGQLQPAVDTNGPPPPYNLGVAVETTVDTTTPITDTTAPKPPQMRLVVLGDLDFLGDDLMSKGAANLDLFKNTINWLSQSEERISVRPKDTTDRTLTLNEQQTGLIAWGTIVFLPVLTLLLGLFVWWRRR